MVTWTKLPVKGQKIVNKLNIEHDSSIMVNLQIAMGTLVVISVLVMYL